MKILHLILSKGFAGSERYVCDLINYQIIKNKVYLIKLKSQNTKFFKNIISKKTHLYEISNFFKEFNIKKIIKKINPNIIHTHLGDAAKIISKKWGNYKIITTMHMNYKQQYFKKMDGIICSNSNQFNNIKKKFNGKIFQTVLWPVEKIKKTKLNLKKKLKIPQKNFIFGSIGRFHKQKGFDLLCKTFDEISLNKTTLILVGPDSEELSKKFQHNKNIIFIDHVKHPSYFYQIFDAAIFASRWESFGITLLEAMKHKLPIISTVHEGNQDWINKFKIKKIRPNNELDLKKSIILFRKLKPKKIKYNLKYFEYKKICKQIQNFYHNL